MFEVCVFKEVIIVAIKIKSSWKMKELRRRALKTTFFLVNQFEIWERLEVYGYKNTQNS